MKMNDFRTGINSCGGAAGTAVETICGISVQLVFAPHENLEAPGVVGNILKNVRLRQMSR